MKKQTQNRNSKQNWLSMNATPKAFRQRTTPEFKTLFQAILATQKFSKTNRTMEEAREEAKKHPLYAYLDDKKEHEEAYSDLEGSGYYTQPNALQLFVYACKKSDADEAAQIITVWRDNTWRMLKDVI